MVLNNPIARRIKGKAVGLLYRIEEMRAIAHLKGNKALWTDLEAYLGKSESTGCSYTDYSELYKFVRNHKPTEILECGPGATTLIMVHALMENEKETGIRGRITAMEEIDYWYKMASELLPEHCRGYVDLVLSPRVEDAYSIFRGVRYQCVPDRPYEFVFVDGPNYKAPSDGAITFDFDFIKVVMNSDVPVYAIVDTRVTTCYVFQKVFGLEKVRYNGRKGLGFVGPCTKEDLKTIDKTTPSKAFADSIKLFGRNRLDLKM